VTGERAWEQAVNATTRVRVVADGVPVHTYAAVLEVLVDERWTAVRLIDNAHGRHEMHKYTGKEKQVAEPFMDGDVRDVMPKAIAFLQEHSEGIVRTWKR
jgi:hypothetical protein